MGLLAPKDLSSGDAPAEIYNYRIYLLALCSSMGSAMFGYDSAFIGGSLTLPAFESRFNFADASSSYKDALSANIVSTFQAGCLFGAIICWLVTEKLGRRLTLIICGVVFDIGVILQLGSPGILGLIYAGRVLTGLGVGASSLIVPVYISECAPPAIRGRLVGLFEICLQFSMIIGFWVNCGVNQNIPGTSNAQWRIPFGLQLAPATLLCITMLFQPESPRWLLKSGQPEAAIDALVRIRKLPRDHRYLNWELDLIVSQLTREQESHPVKVLDQLKVAFGSKVRPRLLIGMALMLLQNLSGINALNYYSPTIFESIGFSGSSVDLLATGVFGIVKTITTVIFMFFIIDRFGRRPSLIFGSSGAILAMYYLGAYTKISGSFEHSVPKDAGAYIGIVMVYFFAVFYCFSWNAIPWIFCAEVFPTEVRSMCLMFTTCMQWLSQFIIAYSTPYMIADITYGVFLFFGSWVVIGVAFAYFFMPETKGLAMEDIDVLFSVKGSAVKKRAETEHILEERRDLGVSKVADLELTLKPESEHVEA